MMLLNENYIGLYLPGKNYFSPDMLALIFIRRYATCPHQCTSFSCRTLRIKINEHAELLAILPKPSASSVWYHALTGYTDFCISSFDIFAQTNITNLRLLEYLYIHKYGPKLIESVSGTPLSFFK